jgi:seryl-tRNA synthetase
LTEARARKASQAERVVLESQVRERVLMSEIEALERRRDALQRQTATIGPQSNVPSANGAVDQASAAAAIAAVSDLQTKIDAMQTALEAAIAKLKHKQKSNEEASQSTAVVFVDQLEQTLASTDAPGAFDPERSRVSVDTLSPHQRLLWSRCQQVTRGILSQFDGTRFVISVDCFLFLMN